MSKEIRMEDFELMALKIWEAFPSIQILLGEQIFEKLCSAFYDLIAEHQMEPKE